MARIDQPTARPDLEVRDLPDGCAILDLRTEAVHILNPEAAYVLSLCDGTRSVAEIAAALHEVAPALSDAQARADTEAAIHELRAKELLAP